jgi:hypothetical protein
VEWLLYDRRPGHFLVVCRDPAAQRAIAPCRALMLERSPTDEAPADARLKPRRPPSLCGLRLRSARSSSGGATTTHHRAQLAATIATLFATPMAHACCGVTHGIRRPLCYAKLNMYYGVRYLPKAA